MINGLLGKKIGMSQVFAADGQRIPVTVLEAGPCTVLQKKTVDTDGYEAVQLGFGTKSSQRTNKPEMGHFKKAGKGAFSHVREFQPAEDSLAVGDEVSCEIFKPGDRIDVTGVSKGKGFQGVMKRWGFAGDALVTVRCSSADLVRLVSLHGHQRLSRVRKCRVSWVMRQLQLRT